MATARTRSFGELLRRHRLAAGFTLDELAERAGLSANGIGALERGGRRSPHRETVSRLAGALQLPPTERAALEAAARQHDAPLPGSLPPRAGQVRERAAFARRPRQLPIPPTPLLGREREVADLCALLGRGSARLVTLTGPPGVGKTRLALEVAAELADDFADGVWFVPLARLADPALVLPTIARTLGLQEAGSAPIARVLREWLRTRHLLLLLDNCEQVLEAAPRMAELLEACLELQVLVTSRMPLHLRGEREYPVPPLALPPAVPAPPSTSPGTARHQPQQLSLERLTQYAAVALFAARAQDALPRFQLAHDTALTVAQICARLDGLPLAIELAARWVKLLSPAQLVARLESRLPLLVGGARDTDARQQTMHAALAWSYDLLSTEGQRLFRRLAVFVGGWTLEAAEAVCAQPAGAEPIGTSALAELAALVDQSLVQRQWSVDGEGMGAGEQGGEARFRLLHVVREYALERLEASAGGQEAEALRRAHAVYYLGLVEQAEQELTGPQQLSWFERLEREHDNLRAALSWLEHRSVGQGNESNEMALRFGGALWRFWRTRGYVSEGRRWLECALDQCRGVQSAVRARALTGAGHLAALQDDVRQAEVRCGEGLALYRELGDHRGSATALTFLGYAALLQSNYTQARARLEEALTLFREVGDIADRILTLSILSSVLLRQGRYARAQVLVQEALMLSETAGDVRDRAFALVILGLVLLSQGDLAQAQACLEESLDISRRVGYTRNLGIAGHLLGLIAFRQGNMARACSLLEESLGLLQEVGERGRIAEVLRSQGLIVFSQGDALAARALLEESLKLSIELDQKWDIAGGLEGLAAVAAAQGDPQQACRMMSAAQALREGIGTPLLPLFQPMDEFTMASVRTQLGEQTFAAAWAEGRTLPLEHILAHWEQ